MSSIAIVDAGPLFAVADRAAAEHAACVAILRRPDLHLVMAAFAVAEASYLIGSRLGARAEAAFLGGLERFDVQGPSATEWSRISELVTRYADMKLGGADASVVALAERLEARIVVTLDRRHFGAVRPSHIEAFELLP